MILRLDREDVDVNFQQLTWGDIYVDGAYECCTLEDQVRERAGQPVSAWKVTKQTAIPAGVFRIEPQNSPHFGPNTLTLIGVPGFDFIRIHGGTTVDDTEGCILVGSRQDRGDGTLHGAKVAQRLGSVTVAPALATLHAKVMAAFARRDSVHIQVRNGPAWYRTNGIAMPMPLP